MTLTLLDKVNLRIKKNEETGCWDWTGGLRAGRPVLFAGGAYYEGRRVVWELFRGPVGEGRQVRSTCPHKNKLCVNVDHARVFPAK